MIQTFLKELLAYLTNPDYYYSSARQSFGSRLLFFVVCLGILSISMSLRIQLRLFPILKENVTNLSNQFATWYPADYIFSWDGTILSSQPQQLQLAFPTDVELTDLELPQHASFIDTTHLEFSEASLASFSAMTALSATRLYVHQQTGSWQSVPLQDLLGTETRVLNAQTAGQLAQEATNFIFGTLQSLLPLLYLIMPTVLIVTTLWHHFLDFILISILFQVGSHKQTPVTTLKMLLPLLVVITMIMELALWLYPNIITTFPLRQVAFWILFTYIFWFGKRSAAR